MTPVFEPNGQSVRFNFDYNVNTFIRDPNGTIDARLPRVEKHAVNTEVQLSPFELRRISSFESNAKLGSPPVKWGGIPLLNQIPGLRELPIIGWFVRRQGHNAVTQYTVILGYTNIYPSIREIIELVKGEGRVSSVAAGGGN